MNLWENELDEIFESEFYKTCCEFTNCECYKKFERNIEKRVKKLLKENDIDDDDLVLEIVEEMEDRYLVMVKEDL